MYEELVGDLRYCDKGDCNGCRRYTKDTRFCNTLLREAADAIEELSRMEQDFRQYISDQVNREKGVYACCYCKNRESANRYESNCSLNECDGVSGWAWGVPKEEA